MDHNDSFWVDQRMQSLEPPAGWQPDSAAALARFRSLERQSAAARKRRIWLAFAAAAACLSAVTWSPWRASAPAVNHPGPVLPTTFRVAGSVNAPIVAEIYSDYQCSHCAALFLETVPQLVTDYVQTGKVRLLHRDLPLPQHPYAREAARYVNAAGRLGRYDAAVERIFRTQQQWSVTGNVAGSLAQILPPAEMQRIEQTVRTAADLDTAIDADIDMARRDNVSQTPTLVVVANGKRQTLAPVPPYSQLKGYLDELLKTNCRENPKAERC